jgi:hypothetical protein
METEYKVKSAKLVIVDTQYLPMGLQGMILLLLLLLLLVVVVLLLFFLLTNYHIGIKKQIGAILAPDGTGLLIVDSFDLIHTWKEALIQEKLYFVPPIMCMNILNPKSNRVQTSAPTVCTSIFIVFSHSSCFVVGDWHSCDQICTHYEKT